MKKLFLSVVTIGLLTTLSFVSCKKDASPAQTELQAQKALRNGNRASTMPFELASISNTGKVDFNSLSLNEIATIHNDAMEYVVDRIAEDGACPTDSEEFRLKLASYLQDYFKNKGLNTEMKINSIGDGKKYDDFSFCDNTLEISNEAQALACDIQKAFEEFESKSIGDDVFAERIEKVIANAKSLKDADEIKVIQVAATICRSSSFFWRENLSRLTAKLKAACGDDKANTSAAKASVPWGGVAYADASGAITWGRVGFFAAGGPAGAVACGLAGAAGHSALRLLTFGIFGS